MSYYLRKYWVVLGLLAIVGAISGTSKLVQVIQAGTDELQQPIVVVAMPPDHSELTAFSTYLVERGAVVHNAGYTTLEETVEYPTPYIQLACAVADARAEARARGVDDPIVALVGHSTSAYLASVAAFGGQRLVDIDLRGSDAPCAQPELPDRFVGIAGWYDIDDYVPRAVPEADWVAGKMRFFGGAVLAGGRPEAHFDAAPVIDVLLVHGTADLDVRIDESRRFARLLREAGVVPTVRTIEGGTHASVLDPATDGIEAADLVLGAAVG